MQRVASTNDRKTDYDSFPPHNNNNRVYIFIINIQRGEKIRAKTIYIGRFGTISPALTQKFIHLLDYLELSFSVVFLLFFVVET